MWNPFRKPKPLPHVVFSRSKAAARKAVEADKTITDKLVQELTAQGKYVPPVLARRASAESAKQ